MWPAGHLPTRGGGDGRHIGKGRRPRLGPGLEALRIALKVNRPHQIMSGQEWGPSHQAPSTPSLAMRNAALVPSLATVGT